MFDSRQQYSSKLSIDVCRLNERLMLIWTAYCKRQVMDIYDWRVYGTCEYKMTSMPA